MNQKEIKIEDGKYAIGVQTLKKDANEPSAMANYLSQIAIVTKDEDLLTLALLFQSERTVTGFQIENHEGEFIEASDKQVNEEMERRMEVFELTFIPEVLNARVQYEIKHEGKMFKGDEPLRLAFAKESLEKVQ